MSELGIKVIYQWHLWFVQHGEKLPNQASHTANPAAAGPRRNLAIQPGRGGGRALFQSQLSISCSSFSLFFFLQAFPFPSFLLLFFFFFLQPELISGADGGKVLAGCRGEQLGSFVMGPDLPSIIKSITKFRK